jgi:GNAT superfamily N-acetyltransferase
VTPVRENRLPWPRACDARRRRRRERLAPSHEIHEAGELFLLFGDPPWLGHGVGRMLLAAAHDALRAAGRDDPFLYTEERNARARAVYGAAGYRADGMVRESDFHGLTMREVHW